MILLILNLDQGLLEVLLLLLVRPLLPEPTITRQNGVGPLLLLILSLLCNVCVDIGPVNPNFLAKFLHVLFVELDDLLVEEDGLRDVLEDVVLVFIEKEHFQLFQLVHGLDDVDQVHFSVDDVLTVLIESLLPGIVEEVRKIDL